MKKNDTPILNYLFISVELR